MAALQSKVAKLAMASPTSEINGSVVEFSSLDLADTISRIKSGLSADSFEHLRRKLDVSREELAAVVRIAPRTLSRRRRKGRFTTDESERIYRISRIFETAVNLLDSEEEARSWLKESNRALGGASPLEYADTEPGALEVERLIHRLERGVFT